VYAREEDLACLTIHLADPEHALKPVSDQAGSSPDASDRDPSGIHTP